MRTEKPIERRKTLNAAPLISVIVPIYNVERYVRKCLDSLKGQTLKQIEVICIDDGSTDGSGKIADEYARDDQRFRVIHTDNRGLSAARNRGIDEAVADWLMFVDSDDWVDKDFCRVTYEAAKEYDADLVIFGYWDIKKNKRIKSKAKQGGIISEFDTYDYEVKVVWNKLYWRDLFTNIRYPIGRVYEDLATTHKLVHKAKKIMVLNNSLYYHIVRKGSITQTRSITNKRDWFISDMERQNDLISYGYPPEKLNTYGSAIGLLSVANPSKDLIYQKAEEIVQAIEGIPKELTLKQKIALIIWQIRKRLSIR